MSRGIMLVRTKIKKVHQYQSEFKNVICHNFPLQVARCSALVCNGCHPGKITKDRKEVTCKNCLR